ncbi:MAG: threonine synthase [Acidobacteria bacterium]|nr:MAG: threonine synthase [Acidobacteriota bacterium]
MQLQCSNQHCGESLPRDFAAFDCPKCGDLLELSCNGFQPDPIELKALWRDRRLSNDPADRSGVWRFREFLPDYSSDQIVSLGEGNTPLIAGHKTGAFAGLSNLQFKHLGWNPTGSFKDLGMTVAVTEARARGVKVVACASTGNTAASMAAYAARAGIAARVYLPKGRLSPAKVAQSLDYGAEIVEVDGNFDQALAMMTERKSSSEYFLNSINPFRVEGQKTTMFELMEQVDWNPPDFVVVPGGNLGNSSAFGKALRELSEARLIDRVPRLVIVQARGANALVKTLAAGSGQLEAVVEPKTCASAISIGAPRSWRKALTALNFTKGNVLDVSDEEILEAKSVIGLDGIGCEPASATTLAGIRRLRRTGEIGEHDRVVAILTGHVLKDPDIILKTHSERMAAAEVSA